jgi:4-hydroxybenzoate polyprenyltransferase
MFKRLHDYLKEMYPVPSRLVASFGLFAGIYATTLFVQNQSYEGLQYIEVIGVLTVFGILLSLRIADEFKDAETDKVNFPQRALPSGRVRKSDLKILAGITVIILVVANVLFMPNPLFFLAVAAYGGLMTAWFFAKKYIQPNLLLALLTHNPVQLLLVYYVISIAGAVYGFPVFTLPVFLVAFIFYIPGLAWELSRKIRAPKEENQYVTYSQIFGRSRAILIVLFVFLVQLIATVVLFWQVTALIPIVAIGMYTIFFGASIYNIAQPTWINYGKIARAYMYSFQIFLVVVSVIAIL